jgi:hypothetical protein
VQVPVVGEVGEPRRQYGGEGESGFLGHPAGGMVADAVDEFQPFQRPLPWQAEGPPADGVDRSAAALLPMRPVTESAAASWSLVSMT